MITGAHRPARAMLAALLAAGLLALTAAPAGAGPPPPRQAPLLVLAGPDGAERSVRSADFRFVYFERIFYDRRAPRSEEPSGRRLDIEDRRHECKCVLLEDHTIYKFKILRQIEIVDGPDDRQPRLRLTRRDGRVHEHPFESLAGTVSSLAPRFSATVDGVVREFPLVAGEGPGNRTGERLARVLLVTAPPSSR